MVIGGETRLLTPEEAAKLEAKSREMQDKVTTPINKPTGRSPTEKKPGTPGYSFVLHLTGTAPEAPEAPEAPSDTNLYLDQLWTLSRTQTSPSEGTPGTGAGAPGFGFSPLAAKPEGTPGTGAGAPGLGFSPLAAKPEGTPGTGAGAPGLGFSPLGAKTVAFAEPTTDSTP
jgi:hypothetical protein